MSVQTQLIESYMEIFNYPTLKEVAKDTGIQITRVFRILNGQEMKLTEYEIFQNKISNQDESLMDLSKIVNECQLKLKPNKVVEIYEYISKKLLLSELSNV